MASILAAKDFAHAPRMRELLRFIVAEERAGRGDRLKAFVIAQDVFGRDESFDAQNDTIVRVEMGRLRRRLEHYYLTDGASDPLRIEIPRGGYVPVYLPVELPADKIAPPDRRAGADRPMQMTQPSVEKLGSPRRLVWFGLAVVVLFMAGWLATRPDAPDSKPYIAILPLITLTSGDEELSIATGLIEAIISDLARLGSLSVMAHSSALGMKSDEISLVSLREKHGATHVLRGSVHHEPPVVLANIHLIDTATGRIVWAYRNEQYIDHATLQLESRMALQIAASVSAVVSSDQEALINRGLSTNLLSLALYRQGQTVMIPPFDPDRLKSARFIFERLTDTDPTFAGGPAGVGFTYVAGVMARSSQNPIEDLERGHQLAREAIEIDDEFAMGHATLGFAHAMSGEHGAALAAGAAALERQPGDAMVQFAVGMIHSILREHRESIPYFEEALRLDPIEPRTPYLNLLGIAYLATDKPERTVALLERNVERGGPNDVHLGVYRALAYAELGRMTDAQAALDAAQGGPAPIEPANMLGGLFGPGAELDQALELLMELGYTPPMQTSRPGKRSQP